MGGASSSQANSRAASVKAQEEAAPSVKNESPKKEQKSSEERKLPVEDGAEEINYKTIHSAFRWNKPVEEIEALLTSAAAVSVVDPNNGNQPIHIAAQNGHNDLVKLLIRKKADLNAKNAKGNTGLHMSVGYDYYETSQILINAGADPEVTNDGGFEAKFGLEGNKALGIACLINSKSVADVLEGFQLCNQVINKLDRVNFIQAGLKAKKNIGSSWSSDLQDQFKDITNKLTELGK
jgi:ankyrin repeat protein